MMINGRLTFGYVITEKHQKRWNVFDSLDPLGYQQARKNLTNDFEQVFVDYSLDGTSNCE